MDPVWLFMGHPGLPEWPHMHICSHWGSYMKILVVIVYTFVCSMMRSYCPGFDVGIPKYEKKNHILDLNLNSSYQTASLFHIMYIDVGERITKPRRALSNSQKYIICLHFGPYMKNWFSIVFPCCTYVSTVMRSAFADILLTLVPLDLMYGPNMTPKKIVIFLIFFILAF